MTIVWQHPHNFAANKWFRKLRHSGNKAARQINHGWLGRQSGQEQTFLIANRLWIMIRLRSCLAMNCFCANHGAVEHMWPTFSDIKVPRPGDTYIKWMIGAKLLPEFVTDYWSQSYHMPWNDINKIRPENIGHHFKLIFLRPQVTIIQHLFG